MAKACEECTQSCVMMHKRNKNPAPLVTTFFKVMISDDYSKILFLPPKFARKVKKLVDKTTHLEDSYGDKWDVKFTKIDGHLAFKEGWDAFAIEHSLQKGDVLVFHYIMKSHFVVLMYGASGCPEYRHFRLTQQPVKETKKNSNNLTVNGQSPSEAHTIYNELSHESSSKSEPRVDGGNDNKKPNEAKTSPNVNTTNAQQLVASSSLPLHKETDCRSEPLVKNIDKATDQNFEPLTKNTIPDYMESKSPTTMKPLGLVDNGNGHEADECRRNSLQQVGAESDSGQKGITVGVSGGLDNTESNRIPKSLETRLKMAAEKRKENESIVKQRDTRNNSMHKRSMPANVPSTPAKVMKKEPGSSASRLHDSDEPFTSIEISPKPMANRTESTKKEPTTNHGSGGLSKKEQTMNHGSGGALKKEPTMNHGSGGALKKEPTMNHGSGVFIKREPKPEPVDYDEAPVSCSSNTSFSAIMSSYQYLELPGSVKLKSKVILLRNGTDLWAVLFQIKYGVKALTQNWGTFAKEKGIKPGDKCEFVLESEPNSRFTCNVFDVHVTR